MRGLWLWHLHISAAFSSVISLAALLKDTEEFKQAQNRMAKSHPAVMLGVRQRLRQYLNAASGFALMTLIVFACFQLSGCGGSSDSPQPTMSQQSAISILSSIQGATLFIHFI